MDKRLMEETHLAQVAFIATIVSSLVGALLIIIQAFFLSRIITQIFLNQATLNDVSALLGGLIIVILLRAITQSLIMMTAAEVAIRIKENLRQRLIAHLIKLGPIFTQQERSGELTTALISGVEALDSFFREYLPSLFVAFLIPLVILVIVLPLDLLTFVVLLVTAPLIPIFMILIGKAAGALARNQYAQLGQMSAHFLDVMQGLTTLKLFNRSKPQLKFIDQITQEFRHSTLNVLRVAFLSAFTLELLATISVAVVAVEIGLRLLTGGIAFEAALFLLVIAPEFYMPLRQLGAKFHSGRDGVAAADRIYTILNTPTKNTASTATLSGIKRIAFDDVSHTYRKGARKALNHVSFAIERGEHVAFVGETGTGKSTITNLLMRFIDPESGKIVVYDTDNKAHSLDTLDKEAWRNHIAWVPQHSYLFNMSIEENIRIGQPTATFEDIITAAKASAAHDFIESLPQGYTTIVGEKGTRLSGGQAQRIALARAFLRDAGIYIFDEATANLDANNEAHIQASLKAFKGTRTVITVAHRLNTIKDADRIFVLDGGHIVESGNHAALIAQQGAYYLLLQAYGETIHA